MMKTWWLAVLVVALGAAFVSESADAKRLGGGRPAGMQRTAPDKATPSTPATPNNAQNAAPATAPNAPAAAPAPATAGATAAAAAPKRSWLGPVAGLAAGLGLAALASHLGFGEELANVMMLMLLAIVAIVAIRWLMRRFAGGATARPAFAGASAGGSASIGVPPLQRSAASASGAQPIVVSGGHALAMPNSTLPDGFDAVAFERIAKMIFIRLQAANDKADVGDLRAFTTPELFASLRLDLQDRGAAAQQTDVVTLDAELLDFAQENDQQIVSVRFHGLIREETESGAQPFDEVWHLVRPSGGSGASWAIAGIQPRQ